MATIYEKGKTVADRLLAKHKQGAVYLVSPSSSTPADDPWLPPTEGAATETELDAAVRGVSKTLVDGDSVLETDLVVTFAVPAVPPTTEHTIKIDGVKHRIMHVQKLPEAGTTVAYRCRVRT